MLKQKIKYLMLALTTVLACGAAMAQTVTFDAASDKTGGSSARTGLSITKDGITLSIGYGIMGDGSQYRIYSGYKMTITSTVGNIEQIVMNQSSSTYPLSRLSANVGLWNSSSGTWTGDAASVEFSASGQVRTSNIAVTIADPMGNKIYFDDLTMTAGSNAQITFIMRDKTDVAGLQFSATLPAGITPSLNANGRPVAALAASRAGSDHTVSTSLDGNTVKFMVYSPTAAVLPKASDYTLLTLDVNADAALDGEYNVAIGDILASDTELQAVSLEGVTSKIIVKPATVIASSIEVSPTTGSLAIGESLALSATVLPAEASQAVTWASDNESVATVDDQGNVTAVAPGIANITATTTDGSNLSATAVITVQTPLATSIELDQHDITIVLGESAKLNATILPAMAAQVPAWASDNEQVATVDQEGKVTAVNIGTSTITATTNDGSNLSATCRVTVVAPQAQEISLNKSELELVLNGSEQLIATVSPELASQEVAWNSSNAEVASVDEQGNVTAIGIGTATITAATTDGSNLSASCEVTVVAPQATSIELDKTNLTLTIGGSDKLTATILPAEASQAVTWASDNESVATVDDQGNVSAVASGKANITATTTDGSKLSASCAVAVELPIAEGIALNLTELALTEGESAQLIATVSPELASQVVTWATDNEAVATVDQEGNVAAMAEGEANITATTTDGSNLSATCHVTVSKKQVPVTAIALAVNVPQNHFVKFAATPAPADATNPTLQWTSADETIATVADDGTITGVTIGSTTVTVATTDGSEIAMTIAVNVVEGSDVPLNTADVNNDGVINAGDVSAVYDAILTGAQPAPATPEE